MIVTPKITMYFDVVSPFGYMAFYVMRHFPAFQSVECTYIPIFLGAIMKACNNRPPLNIKNKDKWIENDRRRWARLFNIPIADAAPDGFPVLTLGIQRTLTAITLTSPTHFIPALEAFYRDFWVERNVDKVETPDGMVRVLSAVMGEEEAKVILEMSTSPEVKKALSERVDEALAEGMFGVPYFVATNSKGEKETYWGFDHLGMMMHHLELEKPQSMTGWQAML